MGEGNGGMGLERGQVEGNGARDLRGGEWARGPGGRRFGQWRGVQTERGRGHWERGRRNNQWGEGMRGRMRGQGQMGQRGMPEPGINPEGLDAGPIVPGAGQHPPNDPHAADKADLLRLSAELEKNWLQKQVDQPSSDQSQKMHLD